MSARKARFLALSSAFSHEIVRTGCFIPLKTRKTPYFKDNRSGFTLLELMVVVAIIGILSTASLMSYSIVRDKARVAACKISMSAVQKGFEQYIQDNSKYPEQGDIGSFQDIVDLMQQYVDFNGDVTCEDPLVYSANEYSYKLETTVHYTGGAAGGYKVIVENGQVREEKF